MSYIDDIKRAIWTIHRAEALHRKSVPVTEILQGETVWDGVVEVFDLRKHPEAEIAYAWSQDTGNPRMPQRYVTVLAIPPVTSPLTAVRAFILREFKVARG